uniref:asparagine--tRNA ligase n=1 Tax=Grammatophora oceanica TaxID=210454 RepID=A0A7S1VG72_9STRA
MAGPRSGLLGNTPVDQAHVDGWMSFVWSSIELPLEAKGPIDTAIATLEKHLTERTYVVGEDATCADISLAASLYKAAQEGIWKGAEDGSNLARWYDTITNLPFFQTAVASEETGLVGATAAATATPPTAAGGGVFMNGSAPPVVCRMYRRQRIRIKEVLEKDGANYLDAGEIVVAGWARTTRNANKGQLLFVELNDGSCGESLQCVVESDKSEGFAECKGSGGTGASFQFTGTLVPSQGQGQAVELQATKGVLLGAVYGGNAEGTQVGGMLYPMSKKAHSLEYMRGAAHLRARAGLHAAAMRIRHAMAYATHNFFHNHGFLYIHTPIITCADCEGAGEQFGVTTMLGVDTHTPGVTLPVHAAPPPADVGEDGKKLSKSEMKRRAKNAAKAKAKADPNKPVEEKVVGAVDYGKDFFGRRANLTVSGQLNVETHACALSDVYTFGPTFRAENSHTGRHLSEFWMIEPEIAFADLDMDINLAEDYLKYCVEFALDRCADDLEFFEKNQHGEEGLRDRLRNVLENPFKRLTYTEAIELLQKAVADGHKFEETPEWGMDLPSEMERYLCETIFKMPVVLTDYPKDIKAFYMKLNDDGKTVAAADILVPKIGEIIGGSQREHRMDVLVQRCIEMGLDPKSVWWYVDLRKYGTIPHAGFGLGFERLILFVTGLQNIRDVIPFPRWAGNAEF